MASDITAINNCTIRWNVLFPDMSLKISSFQIAVLTQTYTGLMVNHLEKTFSVHVFKAGDTFCHWKHTQGCPVTDDKLTSHGSRVIGLLSSLSTTQAASGSQAKLNSPHKVLLPRPVSGNTFYSWHELVAVGIITKVFKIFCGTQLSLPCSYILTRVLLDLY